MSHIDSLKSKATLEAGDKEYHYHSIAQAAETLGDGSQ